MVSSLRDRPSRRLKRDALRPSSEGWISSRKSIAGHYICSDERLTEHSRVRIGGCAIADVDANASVRVPS